MKTVLRFLHLAQRIPGYIWAAVVLTGLIFGAIAWQQSREAAAYAQGRQDVIDEAKVDSALLALTDSVRAKAERSTDSVITIVKWRVAAVDSQAIIAAALARQLPPEIGTMPEVVALKDAVFALAASTRALRDSIPLRVQAAVDAERASQALQRDVLQAQLTESRLVNIALVDENTQLKKRPTWVTVGKVAGTALGTGVVVGRWLIPLITK